MKNGPFLDIESFRTIDTRRILYLLLCVFAFVFTEVGRFIYRPYIYANEINDFGIADSIGNLGGIMVQIFLGMTLLNPSLKKGLRLVLLFTIGYFIYEFAQPYFPKGVFDWKDVYGTIIGGGIATILLIFLHRKLQNNRVYHKF